VRIFELKTPKNRKIAKKYRKNKLVEIIWGDLRNFNDVERAVQDIDIVIHLGAIIPPLADIKPELAEAVNVYGTNNIIQAMEKKVKKKPKLIFTSSISVYGDRINNPYIKSDDPLTPSTGDFYAETKIRCEGMIRHSSLDWSIMRLSYITSISKLEMDPLMFHMPLKTSIEICCSKDVGYALVNAIECEEIWGGTFHIGGGVDCRTNFREYLNEMTDLFGLGKNLLPDEAFATKDFHCGFYDTEKSQKLLKYQRHTLSDYYQAVKRKMVHLRRTLKLFKFIVRPSARLYLLSQSAFYKKKELYHG
jgi:nucleoside-diphosphate-sugar epimerase